MSQLSVSSESQQHTEPSEEPFNWTSFVLNDPTRIEAALDLLHTCDASSAILYREAVARSGVCWLLGRFLRFPGSQAYPSFRGYDFYQCVMEVVQTITPEDETLRVFTAKRAKQIHAIVPEKTMKHIRLEYTRLFVTPPSPVSMLGRNYCKQVAHIGERVSVERFFQEMGLKVAHDNPEPADHIVCELEFISYVHYYEALAWLTEEVKEASEWRALRERFLAEHARNFILRFADALEVATRSDFYIIVSHLLRALATRPD